MSLDDVDRHLQNPDGPTPTPAARVSPWVVLVLSTWTAALVGAASDWDPGVNPSWKSPLSKRFRSTTDGFSACDRNGGHTGIYLAA